MPTNTSIDIGARRSRAPSCRLHLGDAKPLNSGGPRRRRAVKSKCQNRDRQRPRSNIQGGTTMKTLMLSPRLATFVFAGTAAAQTPNQTPSWLPPADSARCPSKWGAGDERGAGNHMKPQTVLNAAKLIKTGEVIELSHPLNAQMPLAARRVYDTQVKRSP